MLFGTLACHVRYGLLVMIAVVVIILFSKWTGSTRATPVPAARLAPPMQPSVTLQLVREAKEYTDAPAPNSIVGLMQTTHALALLHAVSQTGQTVPPGLNAVLKERQLQAVQHITSTYPELLNSP